MYMYGQRNLHMEEGRGGGMKFVVRTVHIIAIDAALVCINVCTAIYTPECEG